jgi:hypothetical protein
MLLMARAHTINEFSQGYASFASVLLGLCTDSENLPRKMKDATILETSALEMLLVLGQFRCTICPSHPRLSYPIAFCEFLSVPMHRPFHQNGILKLSVLFRFGNSSL